MSRVVRWLLATDHKVVALRFLCSGLAFLAVGGALAMVIRWQRAFPGQPVPLVGSLLFPGSGGAVTPPAYTALFTGHGLIMIFFAVTPMLIGGIGNYVVPLAIGSRGMALPRLTALSFWLTAAAQAVALASLLAPTAPSAGWTSFPPLATGAGAPGAGQTLMMIAILLAGCGTVLGALGLVTTVVSRRAPGMTWLRLPLSVWGAFLASSLSALFAPILVAATLLLLLDRVGGTQMFAGGRGDPVLYQHLFWIFGHPEVYILILPVWGVLGDLIAFFSRRPAFWYRGTVLAMLAVASMSGLVYGHHMFRAGLQPLVGAGFETLTLAISAPATVLMVNWLATLWRGTIRLTLPMLFALGTVAVLGLGGLSGMFLGSITLDIYLHDTMWVVGHFHLIMATATLMGSFAAIHFWFPKMTGRQLGRRLGLVHFWGTLVLSIATFGGMLALGYAGQPRRYHDTLEFAFLAGARGMDRHISYAGFLLGAVQILFFVNLIVSARRGRSAGENPWEVTTLEWSVASPPPVENFRVAPGVRRGPHSLGGAAGCGERDWIGQWEGDPDPEKETGDRQQATGNREPGSAADGVEDVAPAVAMTVFLASWAIVCGALVLAGVSLGGVRPGVSVVDGIALVGLIGWAGVLFRPAGPGRFEVGAGLAGVAAVAAVLGWPDAWPPEVGRAPLVLLGGLHLVAVVAGGMATAWRRGWGGRSLLRWYAAALAVVWMLLLVAGRS